jgi:hypothetical protein
VEVRVTPRAGRDAVEERDGVILVHTRATAEGGKATEAVRKALARWLGVSQDRVRLIAGGKSRKKLFRISQAG